MKFSVLPFALALTVSLGALDVSSAEQYIYKWKDAQGMVHYTERRPDPGIPFEKVRRRADKSEKPVAANPSSPQQTSKKDTPKDDSYGSWREENCRIATQNLDILQNASRIAQDDGQGGTRLMTDEEKAEKVRKMTEQKDKYCSQNSNG